MNNRQIYRETDERKEMKMERPRVWDVVLVCYTRTRANTLTSMTHASDTQRYVRQNRFRSIQLLKFREVIFGVPPPTTNLKTGR